MLLLFGLVFGIPWYMFPGLMSQKLMVFGLFFLSVHTYVVHWNEPNLFYAGLVPGVAGFVFLYFWIVNMAEFNALRAGKSTNAVSPEAFAETGSANNYM